MNRVQDFVNNSALGGYTTTKNLVDFEKALRSCLDFSHVLFIVVVKMEFIGQTDGSNNVCTHLQLSFAEHYQLVTLSWF